VPTLLRIEGFEFFFYSSERTEPPHVHVWKGGAVAKLWLRPVRLAYSHGLSRPQLRRVQELVFEHQVAFVARWNDYFGR
jgi:uncharacterized protein DUF4160